jgi:multidrug efflux pump subunit AcrA (membrane-fusion protein)
MPVYDEKECFDLGPDRRRPDRCGRVSDGRAQNRTTRLPQLRPIVETVHPHRVDLIHRLDSNATIEAYETADLYPKVSGYLSEVKVDIGDHVKSGQLLAVISIPELEKELAEDKAQLEAKQADLALQQLTLKRQETLFRAKGITEQALDEIRSKTAIAAAEGQCGRRDGGES